MIGENYRKPFLKLASANVGNERSEVTGKVAYALNTELDKAISRNSRQRQARDTSSSFEILGF